MSSSRPLISVLVTVYNRERYLAEALNSIKKSSFSDIEVIIVDDCSKDQSCVIAEKFSNGDPRFKLHRNERNLGQFGNRNRAAALATGRYIKYLDSDDFLYRHSLNTMLEAIESCPHAACAISSPVIDPVQPYPFVLTPQETYREEFLGRGCLSAGPSGAIINRKHFFSIGGFRDVGVVSDIDLWYRLGAKWDTVLIQPALVWWRQHDMQAFTAKDSELDYLTGEYRITVDALNSMECPFDSEEKRQALRRKKQHFARKLIRYGIRRRKLSAIRIGKRQGLGFKDMLTGLRKYY
jgi:glycosyltransferase involved in cell wall biosynthesis